MKKHFLLALTLILAAYCHVNAQCPAGRYITNMFTVDSTMNVTYGSNTATSGGGTVNLNMDIYMPHGDTMQHRPVIIFAHGGSFVGGTRDLDDMRYYCKKFAQKGYITATIDYRLESIASVSNTQKMVTEVIRAQQDGRAAVRFFRADAAGSNTYKVDDTQIFFAGTSAGGILGIHLAYMDTTDPLPATWVTWANSIGGIEGGSGHPGFSSKVKAVVSFAGAIGDVSWMNHGDVPWADFHSINDGTVLDTTGYPLSIPTLPSLSGGKVMDVRANSLGQYHLYREFPGSYHPPFTDGNQLTFDTIELRTMYFLYSLIECNPAHVTGIHDATLEQVNIGLYPNPAHGSINLTIPQSASSYSISITDALGREVRSMSDLHEAELNISTTNWTAGMYQILVRFNDSHLAPVVKKIMAE